jgi:iron-sulfur cluster repair protein YtfE (RIC family)
VNEALSWDHDRLDDLESRSFKARERGDFAEAKALYAVFAFGLRRHIRFEEELLFPEFEKKAGFPAEMGPTAVMRDEHLEILDCLNRIEQAIGDGAASLESLRHGLHLVLGNHNLKEENIVYPMTDQALGGQDTDALVARIQAV